MASALAILSWSGQGKHPGAPPVAPQLHPLQLPGRTIYPRHLQTFPGSQALAKGRSCLYRTNGINQNKRHRACFYLLPIRGFKTLPSAPTAPRRGGTPGAGTAGHTLRVPKLNLDMMSLSMESSPCADSFAASHLPACPWCLLAELRHRVPVKGSGSTACERPGTWSGGEARSWVPARNSHHLHGHHTRSGCRVEDPAAGSSPRCRAN